MNISEIKAAVLKHLAKNEKQIKVCNTLPLNFTPQCQRQVETGVWAYVADKDYPEEGGFRFLTENIEEIGSKRFSLSMRRNGITGWYIQMSQPRETLLEASKRIHLTSYEFLIVARKTYTMKKTKTWARGSKRYLKHFFHSYEIYHNPLFIAQKTA